MKLFYRFKGKWQQIAGANLVSPTIKVGTVTTLDAGSNATVTNSGTDTDAVFNFGLPKGATGPASNPDYSNGVAQTVTTYTYTSNSTYYYAKCTASISGLLVFSGYMGTVNAYNRYISLRVGEKVLFQLLPRTGNNTVSGIVKKGDVCDISTGTSAWSDLSAIIYPFA